MSLISFIVVLMWLLVEVYTLVAVITFICSTFKGYYKGKPKDVYTILEMSFNSSIEWPYRVYKEIIQ